MGNNSDESLDQPGFYAINLGGDLLAKQRGDWGSRRSHRVCTPSDPSLSVGEDLSVGDEVNAEAGNVGMYVDVPEDESSEPVDGNNNSVRQ